MGFYDISGPSGQTSGVHSSIVKSDVGCKVCNMRFCRRRCQRTRTRRAWSRFGAAVFGVTLRTPLREVFFATFPVAPISTTTSCWRGAVCAQHSCSYGQAAVCNWCGQLQQIGHGRPPAAETTVGPWDDPLTRRSCLCACFLLCLYSLMYKQALCAMAGVAVATKSSSRQFAWVHDHLILPPRNHLSHAFLVVPENVIAQGA